jgi:cytoskeletal protein CcmA (bactofilin family)/DNA-binding winged helix-turn-helix (wHTH) protein
MAIERQSPAVLRFGSFELDLRAGELHKQGLRVKLQEQPFRVLSVLLRHPGEVVNREELRSQIWPADTFVDFDNGLNTAINKLREALGDFADTPCFIQTLPRRGYRFPIFPSILPPEVVLMETPKTPDTARGKMILIGQSVVIKGELSCGEDLYIDGQVEGTIDPKGNRLTIGPNGRVKANVTARVVVVQGKMEGDIQASDRVDLMQPAVVMGDIATHRISIDEGAYFKGSLNIQKEATTKEVLGGTARSSK